MLFISLLVFKHFLSLDVKLTAIFSDMNYTGGQERFSPTYLRRFQKSLKNLESNIKDFKNGEMKKTISQSQFLFQYSCS